jgi:TonB family protein
MLSSKATVFFCLHIFGKPRGLQRMSSRKTHLVGAFLISLALHAVAGMCAAKWISLKATNPKPVFRRGESSVMVTFLPLPATKAPEPVGQQTDATPDSLRDAGSREEQTEILMREVDGDPFEKGVASVLAGDTEIRPRYPFGSRIRGEQGIVTLAVTIGRPGRAEKIEVVDSSGHCALDRSAMDAVRKAQFTGDRNSPCQTRFTFRFELLKSR